MQPIPKTFALAAMLLAPVMVGATAKQPASTQAESKPAASAPGYHTVGSLAAPDGAFGNAVIDLESRQMLIAQQTGVTALDLDLQTVKGGVVAGTDITGVAATGGSIAAATDKAAGKTILFDARSLKPLTSIATGGSPVGAVFEPKSGLYAILNGAGTAAIVDPVKHAVISSVPLGGAPAAEAATDGAGFLYIARADGSEIEELDPASHLVTQHFKLAGCASLHGLAYSDEASELIAACGNGQATLLQTGSGKQIGTVAIGKSPGTVLFDRDRHTILIPDAAGALAAIALDPDGNGTLVQTLHVPSGIRNGAVDPVTGRIFLLAPGSAGASSILVIDPA